MPGTGRWSGRSRGPYGEGLRDQIWAAETALAAAASAQRAWKGGTNGGAEASEATLTLARERATEALSLPLIGGYGRGFEVTSSHSELVDPFRDGVPGDASAC